MTLRHAAKFITLFIKKKIILILKYIMMGPVTFVGKKIRLLHRLQTWHKPQIQCHLCESVYLFNISFSSQKIRDITYYTFFISFQILSCGRPGNKHVPRQKGKTSQPKSPFIVPCPILGAKPAKDRYKVQENN